jgi:hypothetical protein
MKPFDQKLYDENDLAKHIVIDWLETFGIRAKVNPDDYGIDLLGDKDGKLYEIEVEVKHNWKGREFPFDTLHYPARKLKFLHTHAEVKFVTLNHTWRYAAVVDGRDLISCRKIKKKTSLTPEEEFIEVPRELIKFGVIDANL